MDRLIDHAHLSAQTFGDQGLARELLALFEDQCRRLVPGIVAGGLGRAERADLAHTLKGSALGVGAQRIAGLAAAIENDLRAGRDAGADTLSDLAGAVDETLAEIAALS